MQLLQKNLWRLIGLCLILTLAGCSSVQVNYDYDQAADFTNITTYDWKAVDVPNDALEANPLLRKRVMQAADTYLAQRGFQHNADTPDIYLSVHAGMKEKMQVTDWGGPGGYYRDPWYRPWWGPGPYGNRVDVRYYTEGTLIIDIVRVSDSELIWRGVGTGIVKEYSNQEDMQNAIYTCVAEILDHFPPGHEQEQ